MKNTTKKATLVLIGVLVFSLVAGNVLFADDFGPVTGIVASDDLDFLSRGVAANTASGSTYEEDLSGFVLAQDLEFVSQPFSRGLPSSGSVYSEYTGSDIVNGTDINFVRNGVVGSDLSNLVCMIDGVQVTGEQCVN